MHFQSLLPFLFGASKVFACALPVIEDVRELDARLSSLESVLLMDGLAFEDSTSESTLMNVRAYVYLDLAELYLDTLVSVVTDALYDLGLDDISEGFDNLAERLRLFVSLGLPSQKITVSVDACSESATLQETSGLPNLGLVTQNVSFGTCSDVAVMNASGSNDATAQMFYTSDSGFGVISDIDDTVKVTDVLNTLEMLERTFLEDYIPVPGMPALYASLAESLSDPQFIYITGSPFQLFPFLKPFIETAYNASNGPVYTQNLTLLDFEGIIEQLTDDDSIYEYKLTAIDNVHGMYPQKTFLTVGDSTQKDPETYAELYRQYGPGFITCIWIRRVEGANNTDARFDAAFEGVPVARYRIYNDSQITSLASIDVAGGDC